MKPEVYMRSQGLEEHRPSRSYDNRKFFGIPIAFFAQPSAMFFLGALVIGTLWKGPEFYAMWSGKQQTSVAGASTLDDVRRLADAVTELQKGQASLGTAVGDAKKQVDALQSSIQANFNTLNTRMDTLFLGRVRGGK